MSDVALGVDDGLGLDHGGNHGSESESARDGSQIRRAGGSIYHPVSAIAYERHDEGHREGRHGGFESGVSPRQPHA